jgi:hypothetical protein
MDREGTGDQAASDTADNRGAGLAAGRVAFRVRIGVTGHRRLEDEPAIAEAARAWLANVQSWFPATDATPVAFSLISALAEGADRLIVTTALDALPGPDTQLEAVLPLKRSDYEKDFKTGHSVSEFHRLLRVAASTVQVPDVEDRDTAYERAGQYIVDRCDVLIAVWDGRQSGGRGGTAETISYAQSQGVEVLRVDARAPVPPAVMPRPASLDNLSHAWAGTDEYNRLELDDPRVAGKLKEEMAEFAKVSAGSIHWACAAVANWALPHLVRADVLALKYQRLYLRLGELLFGFAALASTVIAAQVVFGWAKEVALIEVALMLLLVIGVALGRRARMHDQWIAYRSLAEAFRGAPFIALTGLADRPAGDAGAAVQAEGHWFQRAFSEAWRSRPAETDIRVREHDARELGRVLSEGWLQSQIDYHRRAVGRSAQRQKVMTTWLVLLFGVTVIVGLLHASLPLDHEHLFSKILEFVAITLPGVGAAVAGIRDQRQYPLHADRSKRTGDRLERIRRALATETSLDSIRRLALEAQAVMAEENGDWSSVIEFQDLELVL